MNPALALEGFEPRTPDGPDPLSRVNRGLLAFNRNWHRVKLDLSLPMDVGSEERKEEQKAAKWLSPGP